jgi:glycosyltransferase involved in cell wall biosynthesis
MRVGIAIEETWSFFDEIYAELAARHQTTLFERREFTLPIFHTRINRSLFHHDLSKFMAANDVVFFEWASELLIEASHLPKRSPIVTRLHRYELYKWVDRINWEAVDRIILVSQAMRQKFSTRFPDQADKTVVLSPSTSLEKFQPQPKTFSGDIGILCHLTPRKRVYDLILTFYELSQQIDGLHLHIAGGPHVSYGDYYEALLYLVKQLGLENQVTFYDNVSETWEWYQLIDIYISNSYSEGLQVAPMEAMASGCYCLSHHWDGAEELLPEKNLFFTGSELQEKIGAYCALTEAQKQQQRSHMRQLACEKFDINRTVAEVCAILESAAGLRKG